MWIAFIFLYLWDTTQLCFWAFLLRFCCELLSFFCIFEIQHNIEIEEKHEELVVNCFHFSVSLRYNTTGFSFLKLEVLLWIAFIFLYLWDTTQLKLLMDLSKVCCELLSFFCIFEIQHNIEIEEKHEELVVNCFHFSVSLRYNTTRGITGDMLCQLWIAFIFLYLWDTTQHMMDIIIALQSCELLSFFCIFEIQHNRNLFGTIIKQLWIAFIFLYLWDTTQQHLSKLQR